MDIELLRKNLADAGVYSAADIEEICRLEAEYALECEEIANQCVEEGYPSHGSNYDLRCESARCYYDDQIAAIDSGYKEE